MKNLILNQWLFTALLCLILGACNDEDNYSSVVEIESGNLKAVTYDSAKFSGKVISGTPKDVGVCWDVNPNPTVAKQSISMGSKNGTFECSITGLSEGTQYYVRAYAQTGDDSIVYGEQKTCVTMAHGRPVVYITDVVDIAETNAVVVSKMLVDGGLTISEYGIIYGAEEGLDVENGQKVSLDATCNAVKTLVEGLTDNETYYVRAFATANGETVYSKVVSFKTECWAAPTIALETDNVTGDTFDAKVTVASGTPLPVLEYGLVYGTSSAPSVESDTKVVFGEGDGNATQVIEGLEEDTQYYVRPYAINKNGVYYGEQVTVLMLSNKAMISTISTSFVTAHRAKIGGEVLDLGLKNAPITEAGICWSTKKNPTIDDSTVKSTITRVGEFDALQLFCLVPSTTYYARAYVTNEYGTNYGEEVTFTTREPVANYFTCSTEGNYFNGLNQIDTYPEGNDELMSDYQKKAYETVKTVISYTRNFVAYRYYIYPNAAGEVAYLCCRIQYTNSAGTSYGAFWRAKMDVSSDYVYTCTHFQEYTNAKGFIENASKLGLSEDFEKATNFMVNDTFVVDWDDEDSFTEGGAAFYMIPVHSPENYLRMGVFRVTGLTAFDQWW